MSKRLRILSRKIIKLASLHLNILCLVSLHYTLNYDKNALILPSFQTERAVKVTAAILHTELVHKFNIGTVYLDNHHHSFWQLFDRSVQCVIPTVD